jgi:uncharacterized protein (TIGR00730 family)
MAALGSVCVFCGSSLPTEVAYHRAAEALGSLLAQRNIDLVYGGGQVGLMGILADAALGHGGRVTGVIPTGLFSREVGHPGLTELHEVASMHERKALMYDLSDAFIALPGGLGTLEELAEITTWSQLGLHRKPICLLDVDGFWDPLVLQLDRMVEKGFLKPASRRLVVTAVSAEDALDALDVLASLRPEPSDDGIGPEER